MKTLLVRCVCVLWAAPASAQYNWWDSDEVRALKDIAGELRQLRYDSDSYGGYSGGGGYFPVYQYRPSKHQIREWNQHYYRFQRAAAKRAKRGW